MPHQIPKRLRVMSVMGIKNNETHGHASEEYQLRQVGRLFDGPAKESAHVFTTNVVTRGAPTVGSGVSGSNYS